MSRKKDKQAEINERSWKNLIKSQNEQQIRTEYDKYLKDNGEKPSLEQADLFAIAKTRAGREKYLEFTEREIILLLAGELPFMYD